MLRFLFMVSATIAFAGHGDDARALLEQIAEVAKSARSWRTEASTIWEMVGEGIQSRMEFQSKIAAAPPSARLESAGAIQFVTVCDPGTRWTYRPSTRQYTKELISGGCSATMNGTYVLDGLRSAFVVGWDTVQFQGRPVSCEVIEARYDRLPLVPPDMARSGNEAVVQNVTRTLCIDRSRRLILRDRIEGKAAATQFQLGSTTANITLTTVFSNIERDPQLPSDLFRFDPPPGVTLVDPSAMWVRPPSPPVPLAPISPRSGAPAEVVPFDPRRSPAIPIFKVEPSYTEEARAARIEGTVVVSVVIDEHGTPTHLRIVRRLGYGLDEKAMECVKQWRFRPAFRDGNPAALPATIEVNFHLPQ